MKEVGTVLTYTDSDLTNNQTYYYQVSAVNAVGEGAKSNEAPATPTPVPPTPTPAVTTPAAPQNPRSTLGDDHVSLKWTAPIDDGGAAITNYMIYRGTAPGGGTLLTTVGNVLTYNDAPVTSGQKYYYQVSAVNSAGEGERSEEASVKTLKSDPDIVDDINLNIPIIAAIITALSIIAAAFINYLPFRKSKRPYGSISATSSPDGARVFLDGVDKGESPVTLDKIRKGTHIVLFTKSGYSDCKRDIVVNADQTTAVHCDLEKLKKKLRLSAEPIKIHADGKAESKITISVEDDNGTPTPVPDAMEIILGTNIGRITTPVIIRTGDAKITATLRSATTGGTAKVSATSDTGLQGSTSVEFV